MRRLDVVGSSRSAIPQELRPMPHGYGAGGLDPFVDGHGRTYTYLRISVTDRCDLACVYCMPPSGEEEHALRPDLLTFEEWARVVTVFARGGISRVRFTGGEPLVRKDVVRLVEMVARQSGVTDLVMTTNAMRLAELAQPLRAAGLTGVNVSIDSLDADRFRAITRGGEVGRVLAGVNAALEVGLEVKINAVLLGGVNDDEAGALVDWAWSIGATPRFIELMPIGEGASLPQERFVSANEIESRLGARVTRGKRVPVAGRGPARYLDAADGSGRRVGFITAVTDEFCEACNRVRVTARGDIRTCLASRRAMSLRDLVRDGATDEEIHWALHWALAGKDAGHRFGDDACDEHANVGMSLIGG